jgi:hypothetical protein
LNDHALAHAVSPFSLVFAAIADVICELGEVETALIATAVSRSDERLRYFIGCAAFSAYLKYPYARDRKLTESAKIVQTHIRNAVANVPSPTLFPGGRLSEAFRTSSWQHKQFVFHIQESQGRMRSSDVSDVIHAGRHGKFSLGHVQLEKLDTGVPVHVTAELRLYLSETPQGTVVMLGGDPTGFSQAYLDHIAALVRGKLLKALSAN